MHKQFQFNAHKYRKRKKHKRISSYRKDENCGRKELTDFQEITIHIHRTSREPLTLFALLCSALLMSIHDQCGRKWICSFFCISFFFLLHSIVKITPKPFTSYDTDGNWPAFYMPDVNMCIYSVEKDSTNSLKCIVKFQVLMRILAPLLHRMVFSLSLSFPRKSFLIAVFYSIPTFDHFFFPSRFVVMQTKTYKNPNSENQVSCSRMLKHM